MWRHLYFQLCFFLPKHQSRDRALFLDIVLKSLIIPSRNLKFLFALNLLFLLCFLLMTRLFFHLHLKSQSHLHIYFIAKFYQSASLTSLKWWYYEVFLVKSLNMAKPGGGSLSSEPFYPFILALCWPPTCSSCQVPRNVASHYGVIYPLCYLYVFVY